MSDEGVTLDEVIGGFHDEVVYERARELGMVFAKDCEERDRQIAWLLERRDRISAAINAMTIVGCGLSSVEATDEEQKAYHTVVNSFHRRVHDQTRRIEAAIRDEPEPKSKLQLDIERENTPRPLA